MSDLHSLSFSAAVAILAAVSAVSCNGVGARSDSASPVASTRAPDTLTVARPRVEHLVEPLGIDLANPRFSWELASAVRGDRQGAYQLVVGTDRDRVAGGQGELWDSGRVASDETVDIVYAGKPLPSHARLYWAVRVWDQAGNDRGYSTPATFTTGFVGQDAWKPTWIGYDALREAAQVADELPNASWITLAGDADGKAPAKAVRTFAATLSLPEGASVKRAVAHLTADDHFELIVNGQSLSKTEGNDAWRRVREVDLAPALKAGDNAIRIVVDNEEAGPSGLLGALVAELSDGQTVRLLTDGTWTCVDGRPDAVPADAAKAHVLGKNGIAPWGDLHSGGRLFPPVPALRKSFTLAAKPKRATLYVTTLGIADTYLNGRRVTDDRYGPGWTDYKKRVYYRAYDVTDQLVAGQNALGALLGDGWFSGYLAYTGRRDHYGKHARYAAELRVENADGSITLIRSDDSWKAGQSATLVADFLEGETFDARKATDWSSANFDDAQWAKVNTGSEEVQPLVQWHPAQPVREFATFKTKSITEPTPGKYVLDLGQYFAGVCQIKLRDTKPGQVITLRHAERLNPDGTIYVTNLRGARATDTYICRGGASETWEPRFTFHGLQYVEISGLTGKPADDTVTGVAFSSDTPIVGTFESSDAMLNRLHKNIYFTQRANFIDIPTDCPQRDERLGWTADAQVYLNAAMLNADVQPFMDKYLLDILDAQRDDGQFPRVAPLIRGEDDGGPAWADAGTIMPWVIYEAYGDRRVLERQYPSMKRFVAFCVGRTRDDLRPPERFHAFGDWLNIDDDTPKDLIFSAYLAHSAKLTANAARVLGHADDAKEYDALFERAKRAFKRDYMDPTTGKLKGDSQCAYVLAIRFGLVDGADREAAAKHLVANIERRNNHLATGFLGTKDLMLVLSEIGRTDVAFKLLHNTTFPSWGFSIEHGATSIWERWDGWTPEKGFQTPVMNSFAHYSFGAVYQWMAENLGGIQASSGGHAAKAVTIAPQIDPKLTWAKVGYHSPRGPINTSWTRDGQRLTLDVTIPANVTATIIVPAAANSPVTESGKPLDQAQGLTVQSRDAAGVHLSGGGGQYRFESTLPAEAK